MRIEMRGGLSAPVAFAMLLKDNGLSLSDAHSVVTKLVADGSVTITLHPRSLGDLLDALNKLGLSGERIGADASAPSF